jgi:hypothetical protein
MTLAVFDAFMSKTTIILLSEILVKTEQNTSSVLLFHTIGFKVKKYTKKTVLSPAT